MKKFTLIVIVIFIVSSCAYKDDYNLRIFNSTNRIDRSVEEEELVKFIVDNMMDSKGGIYTNLTDTQNTGELPTGHEILSESLGLYMLYISSGNNKDEFDYYCKYLNDKFLRNGVLSWRIKEGEFYSSSGAVIDDLRIVKSLFLADDKWDDKIYKDLIVKISDILINKAVVENIIVNDYGEKGTNSSIINLSYIDLYTLKRLESIDSKWKNVFNKSIEVIENGKIKNDNMFYFMYYDVSNKRYYGDGRNISILDSFLVDLHLSEIGMLGDNEIQWYRHIKDQDVYSSYNIYGDSFTSTIESTSIYSILLRTLRLNGIDDTKLLEDKIESFQIKTGIYSGGFGNESEMIFYSFDNLNALLYFVAKDGENNER